MRKTTRRFLCFAFACLFVFSAAVSASADAWIPPDDNSCNENLLNSCNMQEQCRALNVFVSNYIEAGVCNYYPGMSAASAYPELNDPIAYLATLKHFELNPAAYLGDVSAFEEDGKTYMKVSGSAFERRAYTLFGAILSAEDCPGYQSEGIIIVSAENFNAELSVFASVSQVFHHFNEYYSAQFDVFEAPDGVTRKYNTPYFELPDNLNKIGSGSIWFYYYGDPSVDTFSPTDFELSQISANVTGTIPYSNENEPYERTFISAGPIIEEPPATSAPTQTVIEPKLVFDPKAPEQLDLIDPEPMPNDYYPTGSFLLLFAVVLVLSSVIVFLIIFFSARTGRKRRAKEAAQQPYPPQYPQYPPQNPQP